MLDNVGSMGTVGEGDKLIDVALYTRTHIHRERQILSTHHRDAVWATVSLRIHLMAVLLKHHKATWTQVSQVMLSIDAQSLTKNAAF